MPLPVQGLQDDRPASPPVVQEDSASSLSSAPSSSHLPKGKAKEKQLRDKHREKNREEAKSWVDRLRKEGRIPLLLMCNTIIESKNKAIRQFCALTETYGVQKNEQKQNEYIEKLSGVMRNLQKEIGDYDQKISNTTHNAKKCLDEFDAIPKGTKAGLVSAQEGKHDLDGIATDTKWFLLLQHAEKVSALNTLSQFEHHIAFEKLSMFQEQQAVLEEKMYETDVSAEVLADVEEMLTKLGSLFTYCKRSAEKQANTIEEYETLLDLKNLRILNGRDRRNEFIQDIQERLVTGARIHTELAFYCVEYSAAESLRLLMLLHDYSNGSQENENLQNWFELAHSLIDHEPSNIQKGLDALGNLEKKLRDTKASKGKSSTEKWSREELSALAQLAGQLLNQLEKLLRTCEASIKEYEKLEGIVKDERVIPSLKAIAETITATIGSHKRVVQFWDGKLQELEDRESFLPPNARARRQRPQIQSILPPDMYETTDGIVVGQTKQGGKLLERLGKRGEVTGTYFKDDSGHWIRDYDEKSALDRLMSATVASQTTALDTGKLMEKAARIENKSLEFSACARAEVDAIDTFGDDYMKRLDKKIEVLDRASSRQSVAINQLADILGDLTVMPAQEKDTSRENSKAVVQDHMKRLKEDRKSVESLLKQVRNEQDIHSRKMRNPNEADLRFLWKEGQVESVKRAFQRRQNRAEGKEKDWLDRYTVCIKPGPQGEQYEPWIVHAHFDSDASKAEPVLVHMKRDAEKDRGVDKQPYHSLPLNAQTFDMVKEEAQKDEAQKQLAASKKERGRRRR